MEQINIEKILEAKAPNLFKKYPKFIRNTILRLIKRILNVKEVNEFIRLHGNAEGIDFLDRIFDHIQYGYRMSFEDREKIPKTGRLIITSNHPLGGMDGLALLRAVFDVRKDVKVIVNDILMNVTNLEDFFIPVNLYSSAAIRSNLQMITKAIENEEAVIFFPAGKVSRLSPKGIKDTEWNSGAVKFAAKYNAPILPLFSQAHNSARFYLISTLFDKFGPFLLPHELFNKKNKIMKIFVGDLIPAKTFKSKNITHRYITQLLNQYTYQLKKDKHEIFLSERRIIEPLSAKVLQKELKLKTQLLGFTETNNQLYLAKKADAPNVLREIARLREITFRSIGEGTGKELDMDKYDDYFDHIVLWNDNEKEIIGSYRLGNSKFIYDKFGIEGLYNSQNFKLTDDFIGIIKNSVELGRSFIQPKYWRSNALDYLWNGIGIYISKLEGVKYLWGGVSISDSFSDFAKSVIVAYYQKWYLGKENYCSPYEIYQIPNHYQEDINSILCGDSSKTDLRYLKTALREQGLSIPVLLRRYTEITEEGGTLFYGFGIDRILNSALAGLIVVDLNYIRSEMFQRYFNSKGYVMNENSLKSNLN